MSDNREWLRPKAFGDGMPIVLTLDEDGGDTPWFWSDPTKTFAAGSKVDQAPVWLFHVTSQDGRQWTLDGNLKMTRAIAALEVAHGPLGIGGTFTLEKQIVGERHDWVAVLVNNPNPPARAPVQPASVVFEDPNAGQPPAQGTPPQGPPQGVPPQAGLPPGGGVPPGSPPGPPPAAQGAVPPQGGVPGTPSGVPALQGGTAPSDYHASRDMYRAPWSKKQARGLWDLAAGAATEQVQALVAAFGEDEIDIVSAGDVFCAWQGLVATFVIHGERGMHPVSFGDEGPMPESPMDRWRLALDQQAKTEGLDPDVVNKVLMRVYMEADPATKLGSVLKRAVDGWDNFKALVLAEMPQPVEDTEAPPPSQEAQGPGSQPITDEDIPF